MAFDLKKRYRDDLGNDVKYYRDDEGEAGPDTVGRHYLVVNGVAGDIYPQASPALFHAGDSLRFLAVSADRSDRVTTASDGPSQTAPQVFRMVRLTTEV